jgi:hypothetical protein
VRWRDDAASAVDFGCWVRAENFMVVAVGLRLGRLAQLVEHLVYTERVGGSNPSPPTSHRRPARIGFRVLSAALLSLAGSLGSPARAAEPMSFQVTPVGAVNGICGHKCAEVISAEGEINNDTADSFVQFLGSHTGEDGLRPVILLESPGGTVVGAMQLGMVFRKIGAAVIVAQAVGDAQREEVRVAPGLCMSACVYAFFGGKKRVIPTESRLGIHRMVINEEVRDPSGSLVRQQTFGTNDIVATLSNYTKTMGVDPGVIAYAEQVAPESIHILTPQQINRWHLGSRHL